MAAATFAAMAAQAMVMGRKYPKSILDVIISPLDQDRGLGRDLLGFHLGKALPWL